MTSAIWNAKDYARNSQAQLLWARALLERLDIAVDADVLDIGCGDGKISAQLAQLVPQGRVVGIDNDVGMVELATQTWCPRLANLQFRVIDAQEIDFQDEIDLAFTNSTLHWVPDHPAVLIGVSRALRPAGRLFFSMGGRGTAAVVYRALDEIGSSKEWADFLAGASSPHHFFGPGEYRKWLAAVGLIADRIELVPKVMRHADSIALEGWLRTTWTTYTSRLPESQRPRFLSELTEMVKSRCDVAEDGAILLPMVNLEVEARKAE